MTPIVPLAIAAFALSGAGAGAGAGGRRADHRNGAGSGPSDRDIAGAAGAVAGGVGCTFIPGLGPIAAAGCATVGGWLGGQIYDWFD